MRQWYNESLSTGAFLSLPVQAEEGEPFVKFVQILALETKDILVLTHQQPEQGLYMATIQGLEQWRPPSSNPDEQGGMAEVFVFDEPRKVDVLLVCCRDRTEPACGDGLQDHQMWRVVLVFNRRSCLALISL